MLQRDPMPSPYRRTVEISGLATEGDLALQISYHSEILPAIDYICPLKILRSRRCTGETKSALWSLCKPAQTHES